MITLKGSRFVVEYDENAINGYKVLVRRSGKCEEVTTSLTDDETKELIGDLIYSITDLLKGRE